MLDNTYFLNKNNSAVLDDQPGCLHGDVRMSPLLKDDTSTARLGAEFGYYVELSSAKDVSDFKQRIDNAVKDLSFTEYAFVRLNSAEERGKLNTITPELVSTYYDLGLYEHDMALRYGLDNSQPVFRSTIHEYVFQAPFNIEQTSCMRSIYELNKSYGYYDFYNIPGKAMSGDGRVLLSVTQRGLSPVQLKNKVQGCYSNLQLLCDAIDYVGTRKFDRELWECDMEGNRVITINPKPLQVLNTLANNDLNITQVADKLCISVVTANKHLDAARKALNAKTNYAAIKQAVLNGLIEYER